MQNDPLGDLLEERFTYRNYPAMRFVDENLIFYYNFVINTLCYFTFR